MHFDSLFQISSPESLKFSKFKVVMKR